MFDFHVYVEYFDKWMSAITDPDQLLTRSFKPSNADFDAGLEFFFAVLVVTVLILGALSFFAAGAAAASKLKMFASALVGIVTLFACAAAVYFPFVLLGGSSNFHGTLLTYIYATVPYGPLSALAACIRIGGMPHELRAPALSPATAKQTVQKAWSHPETDKFVYVVGSLITLGLLAWSTYVAFRCLSYAHDLHSWRLAVAIALSFVVFALVGRILTPFSHLVAGTPHTNVALAGGAAAGNAVSGGGAPEGGNLP
jgi:hypothetical protein